MTTAKEIFTNRLKAKELRNQQIEKENMQFWTEAKTHFEQSRLLNILQDAVKENNACGLTLDEKPQYDKQTDRICPNFRAKLTLKEEHGIFLRYPFFPSFFSSEEATTRITCIIVDIDHLGNISFYGEQNIRNGWSGIIAKTTKKQWEKDGNVLKKALDKTLRHPLLVRT
jgi:hypothetical protein